MSKRLSGAPEPENYPNTETLPYLRQTSFLVAFIVLVTLFQPAPCAIHFASFVFSRAFRSTGGTRRPVEHRVAFGLRFASMDDLDRSLVESLVFPTPYDLSDQATIVDVSDPTDQLRYPSQEDMAKFYCNLTITWERIRNAYSMQFGGVWIGQTVYYYARTEQYCAVAPVYVVYHYDVVFNFIHRWIAYGHFLIDFFPVLTLLSRVFTKRGYFLIRKKVTFAREAIALFEIEESHLLELKDDESVFAREMYLIRPLQMERVNALMMERMRAVFAQRLGLDKVAPHRYVFYDRPSRKVVNRGKVIAHVRKSRNSIKFDIYSDEFAGKMKQQVCFFNEILLVMGYRGPGLLNIIFQQTNTVAVIIETEASNPLTFPALARIFKRHLFLFLDANVDHFSPTRLLPLEKVLPLLDRAIEKACAIAQAYVPFTNPETNSKPLLGSDFGLLL
jgi:hypothetical protein